MKKSVMTKWVAALRSGKYKRGSGKLRKIVGGVERHCCLGVLCDISPKSNKKWSYDEGDKVYGFESGGKGDFDFESLPSDIVIWAGMDSDLGYFLTIADGKSRNLADINDSGKYTFNHIADIIEKNWKAL